MLIPAMPSLGNKVISRYLGFTFQTDGQTLGWVTVFKSCLKGTAIIILSTFYKKELFKPWILIPVSSKLFKNGKVLGI